jgi:hypothetical protein
MQTLKKSIFFLLVLAIFITPVLSFGQEEGLVPCGKPAPAWTVSGTGEPAEQLVEECGFNHLMELVNNVVEFILVKMAVPIAAIMFAYAGITLIAAQGAEGKTKAKTIFVNTAIGLVLVAGAYLIIRTILSIVGFDGGWLGF